MVTTAASTVEAVRSKFPQAIVETVEFGDEQTIVLTLEYLVEVCMYLKKDLQYDFLETVTAVDWPERVPRFDIVYQLLSIQHQRFVRLKERVEQHRENHPALPTMTNIWMGANWINLTLHN